jgi:hypothetical protein
LKKSHKKKEKELVKRKKSHTKLLSLPYKKKTIKNLLFKKKKKTLTLVFSHTHRLINMCKTQKEKNSHSLTPNKTWHTSLTVEKATKLVTPTTLSL